MYISYTAKISMKNETKLYNEEKQQQQQQQQQ